MLIYKYLELWQERIFAQRLVMNQAVRPGNEQPVVKKQKMSLAEKRATIHGVQTYLSDEDYEQLMLTKIKTKKSCEEILRDALKQYIQAFK